MARIGVAGFLHETNTFEATPTALARFIDADAWPGLTTGPAIISATRAMNLAVSGFIESAEKSGHTVVPLLWCSANPSGPIEQKAYDTIVADLMQRLARQPDLDALFLDLHGAMVTQDIEDGEGELLRRLRAARPSLCIVAALDFHANLSTAMVTNSDALVAYRTYPHVDIADTGRRAARLMDGLLKGERLFAAHRRLPFIIPMPWQSTLAEPAAGLMMKAQALQNASVPEAQFIPGFPLADIRDCGPSVLVYGTSTSAAEQAADVLYRHVEDARPAFKGRLYTVVQAVDHVAGRMGSRHDQSKAIILADTQDNPGGGGSGDVTDLLHELLRRRVKGVLAGIICDPLFAAVAHAAGVGQIVSQSLGGHGGVGASPLTAAFTVMALGDGQFTGTGPFYLGCRMDLGLMARVRVAGIDIVVSSRKQQAADQAMFRHVGAEPQNYDVLVLKSSVHFRADFAALADEILVVAAPGVNTADLQTLRYKRLPLHMEIL